jgi:mono/diheme cytochrome c family protein
MSEVVDESLLHLSQSDISAMAAYVRSVPSVATSDLPESKAIAAPPSHAEGMAASEDPLGKSVYEGACTACHGWTGISPVIPTATLTGARSVNDPTATNVAQVVIGGVRRHAGRDTASMPAFGDAYSDAEIASVANYVTARFGAQGSRLTSGQVAKLRMEN